MEVDGSNDDNVAIALKGGRALNYGVQTRRSCRTLPDIGVQSRPCAGRLDVVPVAIVIHVLSLHGQAYALPEIGATIPHWCRYGPGATLNVGPTAFLI